MGAESDCVMIQLTQGKFALIDRADWPLVAHRTWCAKQGKAGNWYAISGCSPKSRGTGRKYMHKMILQTEDRVDHIDGNGLNNRRNNLRITTLAQNNRNRRPQNGATLKGAYWHKKKKLWHARISVNNRDVFLGYFDNQIDAVRAYDQAALKYYGEFARLNFPMDGAS